MGDEIPRRTLGDYSRPSHEGYRNIIELPDGNNVVPLRFDTIWFVQNGCSFHGLRSEDPNQHLKDFLKIVDSLNLNVDNRERTRLRLFQFSLRDQACNWLERLPVGFISTWKDLTTRFLAQFFPPGRTSKLRNDILMFQQHQVKKEERPRDEPPREHEGPTDIKNLEPSWVNYEIGDEEVRKNEEVGKEGEWLDIVEPLDLVDTCEESVYESLAKEMPRCSLNYDFRIEKGDPRNLKIPCMIGNKLIANAYIDIDLPMNIMSLVYYNSIRKNRYEYRGQNFVGIGKDMHVFGGSLSYVVDFTILENIEANIDPDLSHIVFRRPFIEETSLVINRKHELMMSTDGIREVTFNPPYKDSKRSELTSEGHDLFSSRVILSEDDYDRGCRKSSDLENEFYRGTIKLGPEYRTKLDKSSSSGRDKNQGGVT
ncbi:protein kinase-like domain, concanavalin A-like lectin/glucanase domain protein [Tanacetum coccineum]|uniref:Protein kinase-like domain, concanavalin A-like lectin/glucanase domain protein n=1 Tax=Tanacetum coccineum TaxID=301880 RepID=A0ABQ5FA88_9ASTR